LAGASETRSAEGFPSLWNLSQAPFRGNTNLPEKAGPSGKTSGTCGDQRCCGLRANYWGFRTNCYYESQTDCGLGH